MNDSDVVIESPPVVVRMQNVFGHEEEVATGESTGRTTPKVDLRRMRLKKLIKVSRLLTMLAGVSISKQ